MKTLEVGVRVDAPSVPAWQAQIIDALVAERGFRVVRIDVVAPPENGPVGRAVQLQQRLDRRGQRSPLNAFLAVDLGARFPALFGVEQGRGAEAAEPDLIVHLGAPTSRRPSPSATSQGASVGHGRLGEWSLRFGSAGSLETVGLLEMSQRAAVLVTSVVVERDGQRREAARSIGAMHDYSLLQTQAGNFAAAAQVLLSCLRRVRDEDAEALLASFAPLTSMDATGASLPSKLALNLAGLSALSRFGAGFAKKAARWSAWDAFHWTVAVAAIERGTTPTQALAGAVFQKIEQPADRFYGDPFLFAHEGSHYLFLESCPYATGRGHIVVSRLDGAGRPGPFEVALEMPFHLSYPLVFSRGGEIFMIPESIGSHSIDLYRCTSFPNQWVRDTTLVPDVAAIDTSFVEHEGRLWLFTGIVAAPGLTLDTTQLCLYSAEHLRGPWRAHPRNPVVADVTRARGGGKLWIEGGSLIRPGQDCSSRQGYALVLNRVTCLSPTDYAEEPIRTFTPEQFPWQPGALGVHTINATDEFCVMDACISKFRGERWLRRRRP